jgi:hypothetical protein
MAAWGMTDQQITHAHPASVLASTTTRRRRLGPGRHHDGLLGFGLSVISSMSSQLGVASLFRPSMIHRQPIRSLELATSTSDLGYT